jgi:hypothetical protein
MGMGKRVARHPKATASPAKTLSHFDIATSSVEQGSIRIRLLEEIAHLSQRKANPRVEGN